MSFHCLKAHLHWQSFKAIMLVTVTLDSQLSMIFYFPWSPWVAQHKIEIIISVTPPKMGKGSTSLSLSQVIVTGAIANVNPALMAEQSVKN